MDTLISYAQANIVLLLFLIIGLGYIVGKLKIVGIALGPTTGILIVGLLVGLFKFDVPPIVKGLSFTIYLFMLGTLVGPGLIHMLTSRSALKYLVMCLFTTVLAGVTIYAVAVIFGLNNIVAGGLAAGALTTSAVLAAAQGAVVSGSFTLPEGMDPQAAGNTLASAYAITYLYGTFGLIVLIKLCPKIVGKDIAVEAAKLESAQPVVDRSAALAVRAWRITLPEYVGKSVSEMEAIAVAKREKGPLPSLESVIRHDEHLEITDDLMFEKDDIVTFIAPNQTLIRGYEVLGEEVTDARALSVEMGSAEVMLTNAKYKDKTLSNVLQELGFGVTIEKLVRRGQELPIDDEDIQLIRGDVLFVSGAARRVAHFANEMGYEVKDQLATDLVNMGLFLAVGGALGTITITVAGISIPLIGGAAIGAMFGGALLSWMRSRSPRFGSVSSPAASAMTDLGLAVFIAAVALGAGGSFIETIKSSGPALLVAGVIVTTVCTIGCFLFGHFVMRLNVADNAGATTGVMTGVAISEVCKDAKSSVPAVSFALPGTLSNVTFILVGLVVMGLLS